MYLVVLGHDLGGSLGEVEREADLICAQIVVVEHLQPEMHSLLIDLKVLLHSKECKG